MVWARMVSPSNCTNTSAADNHCCNINLPRNNNAGKLPVYYYIASFLPSYLRVFFFFFFFFFFWESASGSFEGNGGIIEKTPCWMANDAEGQEKLRGYVIQIANILSFQGPTRSRL